MQILQLVPTLLYGDAVGNDIIALSRIIKEMGYSTGIYVENINASKTNERVYKIDEMPALKKNDIIIYHLASGSKINFELEKYRCKKIIIYHNVTPPEFFKGYDELARENCEYALEGVRNLSDKVDYCLAVSEFNKNDLIKMNYRCRIDVLPIIIPFKDYETPPNQEIMKKYSDGYTNIIFTGRIAPNKKQEDVIAAFYHYKKNYNPKSRLIIVGSYQETSIYYLKLKAYVEKNDIEDVIFTGHIKFDEILAYFHLADLFLCMSEHEGFCVPVVEAMIFDIPIIAYASAAIPETLGNSGFLLEDKNPVFVSGCINRVIEDKQFKTMMIEKQRERLKYFQYENISKRFQEFIRDFIENNQ